MISFRGSLVKSLKEDGESLATSSLVRSRLMVYGWRLMSEALAWSAGVRGRSPPRWRLLAVMAVKEGGPSAIMAPKWSSSSQWPWPWLCPGVWPWPWMQRPCPRAFRLEPQMFTGDFRHLSLALVVRAGDAVLVVPVMCNVRAIVLLLLLTEVLELAACSSLRGRMSPSSATPPPPAVVKVATPPRLCMGGPGLLCEGVRVAKDTEGREPVVWRTCLVGEDLAGMVVLSALAVVVVVVVVG